MTGSAMVRRVANAVPTLTEAQLADYAANDALQMIRLVPCPTRRGFMLKVTLKFKKGELQLITAKTKKPKTWTSADRLLAHVRAQYGDIESVAILFKGNTHELESSN